VHDDREGAARVKAARHWQIGPRSRDWPSWQPRTRPAPPLTEPRAADRTIAARARDSGSVYRPSEHLIEARRTVRVPHDDYEGYVEAHVRRLEALRRAGIAERIDADHWIIPDDFEQRAADYDAQRRRTLSVRVLSAFDLEAQVSSDGATWLDRQILGRVRSDPVESGFGREVIDAKRRRVQVLIAQGLAERQGENRILVRRDLLSTLEQREVARVGQELAENRNIPFRQARDGEHVYGTFKETVQFASGKYALIENAREFTLVPWRPMIEALRRFAALRAAGPDPFMFTTRAALYAADPFSHAWRSGDHRRTRLI
jgi:hypothetical protein